MGRHRTFNVKIVVSSMALRSTYFTLGFASTDFYLISKCSNKFIFIKMAACCLALNGWNDRRLIM